MRVNPIDGIGKYKSPFPIQVVLSCYFICDNHNNHLTTYRPPLSHSHDTNRAYNKIAILPKGNMAISFYNK